MDWMPCHSCCVSLQSQEWPWIFGACARLASLIAWASVALAVLRASLFPALKAMSLALSSARTSAVIRGLWFERVVMVLMTVMSIMNLLMKPVTDAVYSSWSVEPLVS